MVVMLWKVLLHYVIITLMHQCYFPGFDSNFVVVWEKAIAHKKYILKYLGVRECRDLNLCSNDSKENMFYCTVTFNFYGGFSFFFKFT